MSYRETVYAEGSVAADVLRQIRPLEVQNYARATGWQRVQGIQADIAVYRRPDSEDDEIVVPQNPNYADYALRMAEAIAVLSETEHRLPDEIVADLLLPPADVLRFREDGPMTQDGGIGLQDGLRLLSSIRKTLLATACDIVQPQRFHPRPSPAEAVQFVDSCRMGPTEKGGSLATLICPLNAGLSMRGAMGGQLLLLPELRPEPFTRQVTTLLLSALEQTVRFINADQLERLVTPQEGDVIVSSNFYQALAEMQPTDARSSLHITCTWARTIPPPEKRFPASVLLRQEYFPMLEQVAAALRPIQAPTPLIFVGRVAALRGEYSVDEQIQGEIVLEFAQDAEVVRARLELAPQDYAKACDAHKSGQWVVVSGTLYRSLQTNAIHDYRYLHILDA